jgi:hypothetical protein
VFAGCAVLAFGVTSPVRRIAAAASGWGLNPDRDAVYLNGFPEKNDGRTAYRLAVDDVPADAFWSVTVYTAEGFFEPNELNAYSVNSVTGKKGGDGAITIQFGNCSRETPNWPARDQRLELHGSPVQTPPGDPERDLVVPGR